MGVKIKVMARTEEGEVKVFKADGACYRNIGKSSEWLELVRKALEDASPVTLTHENMADRIPATITDSHVEIFSKLWEKVPALRTCITSPQEILSSGRATFDVANYSLNECMVAMFFMRTMVNSHAAEVTTRIANVEKLTNVEPRVLSYMLHLMNERGWSWEKAYMFNLTPCHYKSTRDYFSKHRGGADACCLVYSTLNVDTLRDFLAGTYKGWNTCPLTYREVLDDYCGYTHNIREQVQSNKDRGGAQTALYYMNQEAHAACSRQAAVDLFGGAISEKAESNIDYVDAWGQAYDKYIGV